MNAYTVVGPTNRQPTALELARQRPRLLGVRLDRLAPQSPRARSRLELPQDARQRPGLGNQLDRAPRVVDHRLDLAAVAHDRGVGQQPRRRRARRTAPPLGSRSRRTRAGTPRVCAEWSARRGRTEIPPGSASRTVARRRRPENPTRDRGSRGSRPRRAESPHQQRATPSSPRTIPSLMTGQHARTHVDSATAGPSR